MQIQMSQAGSGVISVLLAFDTVTLDESEKQVISGSGLLESADAQELCQLPRKVSPDQSRLGFGCDWQTAPGETDT